MGTLMAETTIPALNILDAIWINALRGPRTEYYKAINTQIVAVSTDPFALDYWAINEILIPEAEAIGNTTMNKITTDANSTVNAVGYWVPLSLNELLEAGHIMRFGSDNVRIFEVDE